MTYADLPTELKQRVIACLSTDNFVAAKALFENWRSEQSFASAC